ncbi:sodium/hydrogen exchanger 8 [Hevea brasiliensis]|uniref:sodium/hydrogen exchanger 8 n=1 Tax=Hevea brasiliensis TaxID=3981 RepID=UPI0025D95F95|nr:sodium/hydrogen exchanger 8 [Hevea brasiliensis]
MAIVIEGQFPFKILVHDTSSFPSENSNPTDAVIFFVLCLVLGVASRHALRGTRVPYTVALLAIGIALGSLGANIDPDILLAVFLPALLFESSFSMEMHQIKPCAASCHGHMLDAKVLQNAQLMKLEAVQNGLGRCMAQMLLLAGPGVLISTFCLGPALKLAFPYKWSWKTSLLLGGLLGATDTVSLLLGGLLVATDPVVVVALLKELGANKKLSTIIEGESLMNDGIAIVVYQLFYRMVRGESPSWGGIVKFLAQPQEDADVSGVLAVMTLGIDENSMILVVSVSGNSWGYLFLLYVFVQIGRQLLFLFGQVCGELLHYHSRSLSVERRKVDCTKYEMLNEALAAFGDLGDDEELGSADWPTSKRYIASLNNLKGCTGPRNATEPDNNMDPTNLKDIRVRLLNGVQSAYWAMLDEGRITQMTANMLMQSVDEAIDLASIRPLCDWKGLKANVHFPSYYRLLQASICPQKLVTYFIVGRLESACYICAAFLRAHRIA